MRGVNKVILIGNVGKDPELRQTSGGKAAASWSVAVTEVWKDQAGERQERTEWVRCVAWGRLAEIVAQYATKGSPVYCEGQMRTRKYTGQDGVERYTTEVSVEEFTLLPGGRGRPQDGAGRDGDRRGGPSHGNGATAPPAQGGDDWARSFDDDLPF